MEWVERWSEPEGKLALLDSRISHLRSAIKSGKSPTHLRNAAEKVRLAQLSVIKAKITLIREYPERDPGERQSANLREEELQWRSLTTEAIIEQFGKSDAGPHATPTPPATQL